VIRAAFLALTLAAAQAQVASAPSPQPSPLKQIIDIKVRPLCVTLGSSVQVTLVGLMKNDDDIESGRREFLKLGWDEVRQSKARDIDLLAIKNVVAAIVHNLAVIDRVLDDPTRFQANPGTDDERTADRLKVALQAVEDRQRAELNVLNGTAETFALSSMQHDVPDYNPNVSGGPSVNAVGTSPPSDITDAGLNLQPKALVTPVPPTFAQDAGLAGSTPGGNLAAAIQVGQLQTQASENAAALLIVPVATECRKAH
jgi:hypothetical protein